MATLTEDVDRARPDQVTVLLSEAYVQRVVPSRTQRDGALDTDLFVRIVVRKPEHPDAAPDTAGVENLVLDADLINIDLRQMAFTADSTFSGA